MVIPFALVLAEKAKVFKTFKFNSIIKINKWQVFILINI
jgi:hypothetical protein